MSLIRPRSLADTVNAVEHEFFFGHTIPIAERKAVAHWIAARQGLEGAYADFPATTSHDRAKGARVFTGERLTNASVRHSFGEEACRALLKLRIRDKPVQAVLDRATERILAILHSCYCAPERRMGTTFGCFCCGPCTIALWRHITAGGLDDRERRLEAGTRILKKYRDGTGKWRRFPFMYTVLALLEVDLPEAREELRYAAKSCERIAKRLSTSSIFDQRRTEVARRALAAV